MSVAKHEAFRFIKLREEKRLKSAHARDLTAIQEPEEEKIKSDIAAEEKDKAMQPLELSFVNTLLRRRRAAVICRAAVVAFTTRFVTQRRNTLSDSHRPCSTLDIVVDIAVLESLEPQLMINDAVDSRARPPRNIRIRRPPHGQPSEVSLAS